MKLKIHFPAVLLLLFYTAVHAQNESRNILFVGNSITYFNDMPVLFKDIANNKGKNVTTQMHAVGGAGFADHAANAAVYNLFREKVWHAVVLQPGSGESAGATASVNQTIQRGRMLIDSIKKYSPCAKVLLYEIPYGVPSANNYATYFTVQTRIKDSLTKMADNLHVPFVPAGESARMHYTAQQDLLLHGTYNDIHPNLNGSYLVAATMFAAIFQEPVTGTTAFGNVNPNTATYFHNIADQVVLPNKPQWRINTFDLNANFEYQHNNNTVHFTNTAANFTALEWDFGDGTTSSENNPVHLFTSGGQKTVTLKAFRNGCVEIIEKQIDLGTLTSAAFTTAGLMLYPNPAGTVLNITNNEPASGIRIVNTVGQEMYRNAQQQHDWKIDVSGYATGIYFIITDNQAVYKFIKS